MWCKQLWSTAATQLQWCLGPKHLLFSTLWLAFVLYTCSGFNTLKTGWSPCASRTASPPGRACIGLSSFQDGYRSRWYKLLYPHICTLVGVPWSVKVNSRVSLRDTRGDHAVYKRGFFLLDPVHHSGFFSYFAIICVIWCTLIVLIFFFWGETV